MENDYHITVASIKEFLAGQNIPIEKFYLFGSRARNESYSESDFERLFIR